MKGSTKIVDKTKAVWQAKDKTRIDINSYLPVGEEEGGERKQMLQGIGRKVSSWPAQLVLGNVWKRQGEIHWEKKLSKRKNSLIECNRTELSWEWTKI